MLLTETQKELVDNLPEVRIVNTAEHLVNVDSITTIDTGTTTVIITPKGFPSAEAIAMIRQGEKELFNGKV